MDTIYEPIFYVLKCPNLKIKRPWWFKRPSAMVVFSMVLVSYFLITGGVIYDVINEPPSIGSQTDERGNSKPVAFMTHRVNGQYIMEGLAASFMFTLGAVGFIILDQTNKSALPKLNRILLLVFGLFCVLVSYFCCRLFMKIKLPGYMSS